MSLLRHFGTLLRLHSRLHPCIHNASGQRDAAEQIPAGRLPVSRCKDTDRIMVVVLRNARLAVL